MVVAGTCSTHGYNEKAFCLQNLNRQDRLGVLDVDGRNILYAGGMEEGPVVLSLSLSLF